MIISFIGAPGGMNAYQKTSVERLLKMFEPTEVHHGDCLGADEEFHNIATRLNLYTASHPQKDEELKANCMANHINLAKSKERANRDLVKVCELLLAAPDVPEGHFDPTWMVIRTAKRTGRAVVVFERMPIKATPAKEVLNATG